MHKNASGRKHSNIWVRNYIFLKNYGTSEEVLVTVQGCLMVISTLWKRDKVLFGVLVNSLYVLSLVILKAVDTVGNYAKIGYD